MAKSSMTQLVMEWVQKAEADLATARRELRARKVPNYDGACFHAQQCAEKYLKALMQFQWIPIKKTHDLETLIDLLKPSFPIFEDLRTSLEKLTDSAVDSRYPGFNPTKGTAKGEVKICHEG